MHRGGKENFEAQYFYRCYDFKRAKSRQQMTKNGYEIMKMEVFFFLWKQATYKIVSVQAKKLLAHLASSLHDMSRGL